MNVFKKLWLAIDMLATAITGLAVTVDTLNEQIRQRAGIGQASESPQAVDGSEPEPSPLPSGRKRKAE